MKALFFIYILNEINIIINYTIVAYKNDKMFFDYYTINL